MKLYKAIRADQAEWRQKLAGIFWIADPKWHQLPLFGDTIITVEKEFARLFDAIGPIPLAERICSAQAMQYFKKHYAGADTRAALIKSCDAYFPLDAEIAAWARSQGYDGIHYTHMDIYVELIPSIPRKGRATPAHSRALGSRACY